MASKRSVNPMRPAERRRTTRERASSRGKKTGDAASKRVRAERQLRSVFPNAPTSDIQDALIRAQYNVADAAKILSDESRPSGIKRQESEHDQRKAMLVRQETEASESLARQLLEQEEKEREARRLSEERKSEAAILALMAEHDAAASQVASAAKRNAKLAQQDEEAARAAALEMKRYECAICYDDDITIDELYVLDACNHKFCRECLRLFVMTRIDAGKVDPIPCPEPECSGVLTYNEVGHVVPTQEAWIKYDHFLLHQGLAKDPNVRYCPRPGCSTPMVGNPSNPMMVCPSDKCGFSFCFKCQEEWHGDATCEQYQQWREANRDADNLYLRWAREHTKPCPKCDAAIEKNGGCNHMTCRRCQHEFCWLCGVKWPSPRNKHKPSCSAFT